MTQRSAFQVQILEKLGAPLVGAVGAVAVKEKGEGQKQEAERVAALLNKAVQVSIGLAGAMDIKDADGDSARLAMAAMAGPLIAGQYRLTGKVPGDADIKRMVKTMEAVLTFSDNFAPAAENTARLENMDPGAAPMDESQVNIQYISALVPAVNAIASFSFGRAENKLVQEVAGRLVQKATALGVEFLGGEADSPAGKRAELKILQALASVYAECHREETGRLLALDEQARAKEAEKGGGMLPMDPVWDAFERRAGMIAVLGKSARPGGAAKGGASVVPPEIPEAPVSEPAAPSQPLFTAPPAQKSDPGQEPPAASDVSSDQESGAFNPMGFFKPKGDTDTSKDGGSV